MLRATALLLPVLLSLVGTGCAEPNYFPGTQIPKTDENQAILETVETYRKNLVNKNVDGLLLLASKKYFEDSGTPRADDDYGYDGLYQVLKTRLARCKTIRYEIEYRKVNVRGSRAEVEVWLNGAFELAADEGDRYRRVNDYWHFRLEREDDKWKFVAGM